MDISVTYNPPADPRERLRQLQDLRDAVDREIDETIDALLGETAEDDAILTEALQDEQVVGFRDDPSRRPGWRCTRFDTPDLICQHVDCKPPGRAQVIS